MSESEYELIVNVRNEHDIQARFYDGAEKDGEVNRDPLRLDTIRIFAEWLNESRVKKLKELQLLGTLLYDMIFHGEMGTFFEECHEKAKQAKQSLILRLSFREEAGDLAELPWEYLFYKRANQFLSTYKYVDLVLSRFVSIDEGRDPMVRKKSPLQVIIVVSNPEGTELPPVGADQVIQDIQKLAQDVVGSPSIQIDILDKPTLNRLEEQLNKFRPHVLHFIGHGRSNGEKEAEIALLDEDEKSVRWVLQEFVDLFTHINSIPSLVLLHLCESAETMTNHANFTYLAPQLLKVKVPAVVAMQHPITNQAAIAFCKTFYRALARGESIDAAVQEGRWRITLSVTNAYNNRVFGTPVLYMRSHGGIIQRTEEMSSTQAKRIAEEIAPVPQKVSIMTSDISLNPPSRLTPTQDLPIQSTASPSSKQDVVSFVEPRQAKSGSIEPIKPDPNQVFRFNFVKTIILAGENKMAEMPYLTAEQKGQISLTTIHTQLLAEEDPDNMKGILRRHYSGSEDRDIQKVIWSMIEALNSMIEA